MSDISKSSLGESFDAEFEKAVANCSTAAEISELMKNRAVQTLPGVTRDIYDPSVILVDESAAARAPRGHAKSVVINGVKTIVEGATEAEQVQAETALYRAALGQPVATEQPPNERGQFVFDPTADATARIENDLVTRALEAQGIDPEALREFSAEKQQQQWADAVEQFRTRHSDWRGGEENKNLMGQLIVENPNAFAGLSPLESLEKAYRHVVENGLLVENPEVAARDRIANATSVEEIRNALGRSSSGMFGGR